MTESELAYYRDHAKYNRELADTVADLEIKAHLLSMADLFDRVAEAAAAGPLTLASGLPS